MELMQFAQFVRPLGSERDRRQQLLTDRPQMPRGLWLETTPRRLLLRCTHVGVISVPLQERSAAHELRICHCRRGPV